MISVSVCQLIISKCFKRSDYSVKFNKLLKRFYSLSLLWAPAQRKRATMLYFANVFLFIYLFFYGRFILRPWLTEVRENFTRGRP